MKKVSSASRSADVEMPVSESGKSGSLTVYLALGFRLRDVGTGTSGEYSGECFPETKLPPRRLSIPEEDMARRKLNAILTASLIVAQTAENPSTDTDAAAPTRQQLPEPETLPEASVSASESPSAAAGGSTRVSAASAAASEHLQTVVASTGCSVEWGAKLGKTKPPAKV